MLRGPTRRSNLLVTAVRPRSTKNGLDIVCSRARGDHHPDVTTAQFPVPPEGRAPSAYNPRRLV